MKYFAKYFVKYLPVEGDIAPPCIVQENQIDGSVIIHQVDNKNDIDLKNQKLCKLFLCSRDVQQGDKVYQDFYPIGKISYEYWIKNPINKNTGRVGLYREDGAWNHNADVRNLFKVIGQISPEATWVKEGDELKEDDVRFMIAGYTVFSKDDIERNSCSETEWIKTKLEKFGTISKYIEIKCPTCKMFH